MMKRILLWILFFTSYGSLFSQTVRVDPVVDMTTSGFREFKFKAEGGSVESIYLDDTWRAGNISFIPNGEVKNIPVKYDLKNNLLEIKLADGIKVAHNHDFKYFQLYADSCFDTYYNADQLGIRNLMGLVEELVKGKISLYKAVRIKKIPANFNAALNVGERYDRYEKEEFIFLVQDNQAYDITKKGKKALAYFTDKADEVQQFMKENRLSFKEVSGAIRIVKEYNRMCCGDQ